MHRAGRELPPWEVLRALTGHFDPSTVFTVVADSRSFQLWQQELQLCRNLLFLNLSHSGLCTLNVLSGLKRLKYLDISHNNIVRVDQIHKLRSLETLKVSANNIRRLQDLRDLSGLPSLTALYLQKPGGREACPVCLLPEYKSRVLSLLSRETSKKHTYASTGDFCIEGLPLEAQQDDTADTACSKNPPSLVQQQRSTADADFSLNGPALTQSTDAPPTLPTRLRILDGIRLSLPDWSEQADKIQRHVRQREESARCLRTAVVKMCYESVLPPQNKEGDLTKYPQYQQKIAALQAALDSARELLEAFQELKERHQQQGTAPRRKLQVPHCVATT